MSCSLSKCGFGKSQSRRSFGGPKLPPNKPKIPILSSAMSRSDFDSKQKAMKAKAKKEIKYQDFKYYYCGPWTMERTCRSRFKENPKKVPTKESLITGDSDKKWWKNTKSNIMGPMKSGGVNLYFVMPSDKSFKKEYIKNQVKKLKKLMESKKSFGSRKLSGGPRHGFGFEVLPASEVINKTYRDPFGGPGKAANPDACLAYGKRRRRSKKRSKSRRRKSRRRKSRRRKSRRRKSRRRKSRRRKSRRRSKRRSRRFSQGVKRPGQIIKSTYSNALECT